MTEAMPPTMPPAGPDSPAAADAVAYFDQPKGKLALWTAAETVLGLGMDRRAEQRLEETTV